MNTIKCEVCGDKVPHTSYQMAKHKVEDLEKELEIIAERCAKAELFASTAHGEEAWASLKARAEKAEAERDALRAEVAQAAECTEALEEQDEERQRIIASLNAEVERLEDALAHNQREERAACADAIRVEVAQARREERELLKGPTSITIPAGSITPEEVAKLSQQGRVMKFYSEKAAKEGACPDYPQGGCPECSNAETATSSDKAEPTDVASEHERKDRP